MVSYDVIRQVGTKKTLTTYAANNLYISFIRPIFDYCDTIWNCCGVGNCNSLEKFQRRAAKIVSRYKDSDLALTKLKVYSKLCCFKQKIYP